MSYAAGAGIVPAPARMGSSMMRPADDARGLIVAAWPRLFRFACALCGDRADGEDLAQSAVERALRGLARYRTGESMEAWLMHIARNLWRDQLRRRRVRGLAVPEAALDFEVQETPDADDRLVARDALQAFALLTPEQREVAAMILVQGGGYRETADALGVPIGTVMSRLARARRTLIDRLKDEP